MAEIATSIGVADVKSSTEETEVSASSVTNNENTLSKLDCFETEEPSACDTLSDKLDSVLLFDDTFDDFSNKKTEEELDHKVDLCDSNESTFKNDDIESLSFHASGENQDISNVDNVHQRIEDDVIITSDKKVFDDSVDEVLRVYSEHEVLSSTDVECSDGAKDMIQRLLNHDPTKRLRSLISLQNIKFFKDFRFSDVRTKKISPNDVLLRHFPNGPLAMIEEPIKSDDKAFLGFDSDFL